MQRQPDSAFGHFLQGLSISSTGRPELAEKSLQSALQLDPKMPQAYLQLVNLYLQQKRTPEAISQLDTYLKAFPDSPSSPKAREPLKRLQGNASDSNESTVAGAPARLSFHDFIASVQHILPMINFL